MLPPHPLQSLTPPPDPLSNVFLKDNAASQMQMQMPFDAEPAIGIGSLDEADLHIQEPTFHTEEEEDEEQRQMQLQAQRQLMHSDVAAAAAVASAAAEWPM